MGKKEADIDGIKYYYDSSVGSRGRMGCTIYLVPCEKCGKIIRRKTYNRNNTVLCDACRLGEKKKRDAVAAAWLDEIETKAEHRFNQALDEIQTQVDDFAKYDKSVKVARRGVEKYGSIPEAMVAIELLHLGYRIIPQQKIGKYRVDFYVPDDKFVIEVDGSVYHHGKNITEREAIVQMSLGLDVKIIHVPAELIRKNIQKLGAFIDASLKVP